jgi:hypothetical protein
MFNIIMISKKELDKKAQKALSDREVLRIAGDGTKLVTYSKFKKAKSIDDVFGNSNKLIILVELEDSSGHWICLLKYPKYYELYDSYSYKPDNQLKFVPINNRKSLGEECPYLSKLLYESGKPVVFIKTRLQRLNNKISTCGRFVGIRCRLMDSLNASKFVDFIKNNSKKMKITPDQFVTLLTYSI